MAGKIQLTYSDADTWHAQQAIVRANNEEVIRDIISRRVGNDLNTKQRDAAIRTLMKHFQPNLAELDAILGQLVRNVGAGMDGMREIDQRAAASFGG